LKKNKSSGNAIIATARKVAVIIWHMLDGNNVFDVGRVSDPKMAKKAAQKIFVLMVGKINLALKNPVSKGAANICLADNVLESGFAELNITVQHTSILPQI